MGQQSSSASEQAKMTQFFTQAARDEMEHKGKGKINLAQRRHMQEYMSQRNKEITNAYFSGDVNNLHIESIHERKIEKGLAAAKQSIADRHAKIEERRKKLSRNAERSKEAKVAYKGYLDNIRKGAIRNRPHIRKCTKYACKLGSCYKHFSTSSTIERAHFLLNNRPEIAEKDRQRKAAMENEIRLLTHKRKDKKLSAKSGAPPWMGASTNQRGQKTSVRRPRNLARLLVPQVEGDRPDSAVSACSARSVQSYIGAGGRPDSAVSACSARSAASDVISPIARFQSSWIPAASSSIGKMTTPPPKKELLPEDSVEVWLVRQNKSSPRASRARTAALALSNKSSFQTVLDDLGGLSSLQSSVQKRVSARPRGKTRQLASLNTTPFSAHSNLERKNSPGASFTSQEARDLYSPSGGGSVRGSPVRASASYTFGSAGRPISSNTV